MLEYLAVLLIGFWLGVAIFLYISCQWLEEILDLPHRNGSPSSNNHHSASNAHVHLKRLVARVVEEAAAMPALARYTTEPRHTPSLESSTYEDLLASAILNKVIERYQNENGSGGRSSGIHSASASPTHSERSSPRSLHSRHTRDITPPLREEDVVSDWEEGEATDEALELPRRVPFPEFGGDIVHHTDNEDRDFDEVSSSDLQAVDGTWEENWLFQKKKIKTIQSVPVPMLVPNSNTEYRALIGDRDADDTTDLSDNASDNEDQIEYKSDIKKVIDSKHEIGGKIKIDEYDFEPDSLTNSPIDGVEAFDKLVEKEYKDDETVDAIINEINDNNVTIVETINVNATDKTDGAKLVLGINSGPLPKAEFNVNEEIYRTIVKGEQINLKGDFNSINGVYNGDDDSLSGNFTCKASMNTLSFHEREGEYEETVTVPVQRYADSLRRKHFDDTPQVIPTRDTDHERELTPGSVAYRERNKWLNYVEMPNNPYSPEAIQKRLSAKSTSSLFDTLTKKEYNDENNYVFDDVDDDATYKAVNKVKHRKLSSAMSIDSMNSMSIDSIRGSKSPSPRVLKDVISDDIPQYKRYGRDYYIREAKASSGGRKKGSASDASSLSSSMNKSTSLDHFDTEFASPVSASSSLSDLEACALHQNIVRAVLSPRHASPNFAINPIFENPDKQNDNADENHADERISRNTNVRPQCRTVYDGGDGFVENEDIVRLKIPKKPEITEDLFETYTNVRRSNSMRSEDLYVRAKHRPTLNFTFGGSLRLNKGFRNDIW